MTSLDQGPDKKSKKNSFSSFLDMTPQQRINAELKVLQGGSQLFEQTAKAQQGESSHLVDMAQGAAKVQELQADTHRKNAKARMDLAASMTKLEIDRLSAQEKQVELQTKKAENSAVTGAVDDTDFDASVAAATPQLGPGATLNFSGSGPAGLAPGATLDFSTRKIGEVDPRSDRFNLFPFLKAQSNVAQANELQKLIDEVLPEFKAGLAESKNLDLFNSPLGAKAIIPGALLNLLSLPVTLFSGGQGLGTTLLGGPDVDRLNAATAALKALNPLLNSQIAITNANINAQEGIDINHNRILAARVKASEGDLDFAKNNEFVTAMRRLYTQDLSNLAQQLGGDDAVLWTGNAVDTQGRVVETGAGLQLFRLYNALSSDAAKDPKMKAQILREFDNVMEGFYKGTGVTPTFDVFDRSISNLSSALLAKYQGNIKTGLSEESRNTAKLQVEALLGYGEILNTHFKEFARKRFHEKTVPALKAARVSPTTTKIAAQIRKETIGRRTIDDDIRDMQSIPPESRTDNDKKILDVMLGIQNRAAKNKGK